MVICNKKIETHLVFNLYSHYGAGVTLVLVSLRCHSGANAGVTPVSLRCHTGATPV